MRQDFHANLYPAGHALAILVTILCKLGRIKCHKWCSLCGHPAWEHCRPVTLSTRYLYFPQATPPGSRRKACPRHPLMPIDCDRIGTAWLKYQVIQLIWHVYIKSWAGLTSLPNTHSHQWDQGSIHLQCVYQELMVPPMHWNSVHYWWQKELEKYKHLPAHKKLSRRTLSPIHKRPTNSNRTSFSSLTLTDSKRTTTSYCCAALASSSVCPEDTPSTQLSIQKREQNGRRPWDHLEEACNHGGERDPPSGFRSLRYKCCAIGNEKHPPRHMPGGRRRQTIVSKEYCATTHPRGMYAGSCGSNARGSPTTYVKAATQSLLEVLGRVWVKGTAVKYSGQILKGKI